jgi:CRISPR/Cas system-associated protein Cas5 (RAMP superfamily)
VHSLTKVCIKGVYKIEPKVLLIQRMIDMYAHYNEEVSIAELESLLDEIINSKKLSGSIETHF